MKKKESLTGVRQHVPEARSIERNLADLDDVHVVGTEGYSICSWRPGPAGSEEKCTQVHLIVPVVVGVKVVLRLKSARALDELVGVLLEYRKDVWGPR